MKQPKPYLLNIMDSIRAIEAYVPANEKEFLENRLVQDAILMRLQDVGENLIKIREFFPDFWNDHATGEWHKGIGLRNLISHAYGDVSLPVIWALLTNDLKVFKETLQKLL